jgi:hypothetical protein
MKLPRELVVGDSLWTVKYVRHIPDHETRRFRTHGLCDASEQVILIRTGLAPDERLRVFLHELVHAMEAEHGFELDHDVLEELDRALARLILDNFL